jgi:hypothetical protein
MSSELAMAADDAVSDALMEQSRWLDPGLCSLCLDGLSLGGTHMQIIKQLIFLITSFEIRAKLKIRSTGAVPLFFS